MKKQYLISLFFWIMLSFSSLNASYEDGKKIFETRCASCHGKHISLNNLKINFFEKQNKLYNLEVPTVNMLAYAIMDSSKKIGDPNDPEMQKIEIEDYLKDYLASPDIFNSICDPMVLKYYKKKEIIEIDEEEASHLADFFINYSKEYVKLNPEKKKELDSKFEQANFLKDIIKDNKNIIVYATSKSCYFCKKMEKEVLEEDSIKKILSKEFVYIKVDVDDSLLPFDLNKHYQKITPTFFFLSKDKKLQNNYPGSWNKEDFINILKENLTQ